MTNSLNLPQAKIAAIEALTATQLEAIRANLQTDYTDAQTREAVAEYVADGGQIDDLFTGSKR